jgi:hypothetical protein
VGRVHAFKDQPGHRAVDGAAGTFVAPQQSQDDVLLVHDTDDDERLAFLDVTSGLGSPERSELESIGGTAIEAARLVDVAVPAALSTGAAVRVIPTVAAIHEGLGALLRWADAPTGDG